MCTNCCVCYEEPGQWTQIAVCKKLPEECVFQEAYAWIFEFPKVEVPYNELPDEVRKAVDIIRPMASV